MYGKKKIQITKNNRIMLSGGKSLFNIGVFFEKDNQLEGRLLRPENIFDNSLEIENSHCFTLNSVSEIKELAKDIYSKELSK
jgi:hypothetical protein